MSIADLAATIPRYARRAASALAVYGMLAAAGPADAQIPNFRFSKQDSTSSSHELSFTNAVGDTILRIHHTQPNTNYRFTLRSYPKGLSTTTLGEFEALRDHGLLEGINLYNASIRDTSVIKVLPIPLDLTRSIYRELDTYINDRRQPTQQTPQALTIAKQPAPLDTLVDTAAHAQTLRLIGGNQQQNPSSQYTNSANSSPSTPASIVNHSAPKSIDDNSDHPGYWSQEKLEEAARSGHMLLSGNVTPPPSAQDSAMVQQIDQALQEKYNVDPDTLVVASDLQQRTIRLNLERRIERLALIRRDIPNQTGTLSNELEEAYNFFRSGAGFQIAQILARATTVDDSGNVGIIVKKYVGDIDGDGIIDPLDTFLNIYAPILRLANLGKAGKTAEGEAGYKHVFDVVYNYGIPLQEMIKDETIIPEHLQQGDTVFVYSENPEVRRKAEERGLTKFMDMLASSVDILLYARYGRNMLGFDEQYDKLRLETDDAIKEFKTYMTLKDRETEELMSQKEEALRTGQLTQQEYDAFRQKAKEDATEREQHFQGLESKLREDVEQERKRTAEAIKQKELAVTNYEERIGELRNQITYLQEEADKISGYEGRLTSLQENLNGVIAGRDSTQQALGEERLRNSLLALRESELEQKYAQEQQRAEAAERLAAKEKRRADKAERRATTGVGFYGEKLVNHGLNAAFGFDYRLPKIGRMVYHVRGGFSPEGESDMSEQFTREVFDPLRPQLYGELVTRINEIVTRTFFGAGVGADVLDNKKYTVELFLDINRLRTTMQRNIEERLTQRNSQGDIVAERALPQSRLTQSTDILVGSGALVGIKKLNDRLPVNLKFGTGVGYSPEETFLRFLLQAEF
ncbi:hypothetical protein HY491_01490 [Candidatus Woesearchaeota archaeon]|nr:hypothetical protein [Candidatus Woesearchaeota archaeon]